MMGSALCTDGFGRSHVGFLQQYLDNAIIYERMKMDRYSATSQADILDRKVASWCTNRNAASKHLIQKKLEDSAATVG